MSIHATITGRLGADPETTQTSGGHTVTRFRVASDYGWGDRRTTTWVSCSMFGRRGERLADILRKGSYVVVRGELHTSEGDGGRTWVNMDVDDVDLPPKSVNESSPQRTERQSYGNTGGGGDVPF